MSFGLPVHLAPHSLARSFSNAFHMGAAVHIIGAVVSLIGLQAAVPGLTMWPALIALIPMSVALWFLARERSAVRTTAYLAVGAASVYWFDLTIIGQPEARLLLDDYTSTMPWVALILVGAVGANPYSAILTSTIGFVAGRAANFVSAAQFGEPTPTPGFPLGILVVIGGALAATAVASRHRSRSSTRLLRAERDERLSSLRFGIELKAAALMHDTVLNHLSAIATSDRGPLRPALTSAIERDLEVLIGEEWLSEKSDTVDVEARADWQSSGVLAAVEESRRGGLVVELSGDLSAVGRVAAHAAKPLGLAVKQCLVNVLKHSGTTRAEVVVYASDDEVTVMIIDGGRGFDVSSTASDRLGLRASVRARVEAVGGVVQIWSTPGRGTSVMIRVPADRSRVRATRRADGVSTT